MSTGRPAVFLDRDGVVNRSFTIDGKPFAPRRLADFRLMPNAANSIALLKQAGFLVIIVTNQPDIGNGLVEYAEIQAMHTKLRKLTQVDDIRLCPHRRGDGCLCRKPLPGMLMDAARDHAIDLSRSIMVGDRSSDIVAGAAAGCYTIFIQRGYVEALATTPKAIVGSLAAAAKHILNRPFSSQSVT